MRGIRPYDGQLWIHHDNIMVNPFEPLRREIGFHGKPHPLLYGPDGKPVKPDPKADHGK